ncbi:MAG: hypothetical protein GX557_02185, partial [Chloroflexi bacterium]|nr:hypothetical protein [Chloroflexota bacterium]
MDRTEPVRRVVASLSLAGCREGVVLDPMGPRDDPVRQRLADWEMPLAPWGGFNIPSGLSIVQDDTRLVLEFTDSALERALVTGGEDWR